MRFFTARQDTSSTIPSVELVGVGELAGRATGDRQTFTLILNGAGILIVPEADQWVEAPTLVTWSDLPGMSADRTTARPDATSAQVLEIALDDGRVRSFVVPAPELVGFLRAFDAQSTAWAASRDLPPAGITPASGLSQRAHELILAGGTAGLVLIGAVRARLNSWGLTGGGRHGRRARGVAPVVTALAVMAVLAAGTTSFVSTAQGASNRHLPSPRIRASGNEVQASLAPPVSNLPAATAAPEAAPPSLAGSAPLQSHEVFGYAPYWTLPESSGFDVQDLTTLAYFSVDANGDGSLAESGPGWNGYESQDLSNLVTRSHAAGDRVVLTVTCFSQSALDQITSDPTAAATLSAALIAAVSAKNLDGVNFDFEGEGSSDQVGLTALITSVANALHAANSHWQVTMATYASAAGDSAGFYNVAALAPALDGFFVMAYDMNDPVTPSPTAPLVGGGFNDLEALQQYTAVMPASKVILGVPYYGYDWPTTDGTPTAQSTGPESPLSYSTIAAAGNPVYWDASTDTAWTSYQVGSQWHETYFDDPTSMAMKAELANAFHIRGVGIWALGMDGNDPAMLAALLGNSPAAKDFTPGPTSTSSSPTTTPGIAGAGFTSTGQWGGQTVALTPVTPVTTGGTFVGTLSGFTTTDPALTCLQSDPPLDVWSLPGSSDTYEVLAVQPGDCAEAAWTIPIPSTPASTTSTTEPPSSSTTTSTTAPPPTSTTTTSTAPPPTTTTSTATGHAGTSPSG